MLLLTRVTDVGSEEQYQQSMRDAQAAAFAALALAEALCNGSITHLPATMKAHLIGHMAEQAELRGHPTRSNDMWMERTLRADACRVVR